jgi:hypothetical protein
MFPFEEEVRGTIVGGNFRTYQLYTPNGRHYRTIYADTEDEAAEEAQKLVKEVREDAGDEAKRLGYDKPWDLREYC